MSQDTSQTILGTLGINYLPAIQSGQMFARSLEIVNAQLTRLQVLSARTGISNILASDLARGKVILDQYGRELLRVQTQVQQAGQKTIQDQTSLMTTRQRINDMFFAREQANYERHLARLGGQNRLSLDRRLALEAQYYAQAERNARNFYQQQVGNMGMLADQMDRRFGWFLSSIAMFGAIGVFGQTLKAMGDVEMGMIQIQRVTEDAAASFSLMRDELFQLGKDYGTNMATVQDIALRWAQAGYNVHDTLELTKTSLLALNTAELNADQATQALIGIMAQWRYEATDLMLVIDKINKTADDYAVTSQDLVDALLRSSGAAQVMGLSFDQLLGIITAVREASGRTGREVGNAINSILSYMQRPKAIDTFEGLGIKVFADDTRTRFRNVMEIIEELSSKWDESSEDIKDGFIEAADDANLFNEELAIALDAQEQWNDLQKRDLSQAAAGVYRRNYLIALIRNFAQAQEVVNNLTDASGYSIKENERTMEAYQKKVEALKVALTELAVAAGDAGLLGIMKGLTEGTQEAINSFNSLPRNIQNAIILFMEMAAAIGVANLAMRMFTGAGFGYLLTQLAARISGVTASAIGLGSALKILALNPVGLLITALGGAAIAFNLYQKSQEQAIQEVSDSIIKQREAAQATNEQVERVKDLTKQYEALENQAELTAEQEEKLKNIQDELKVLLPELKIGYNEAGDAIYDFGNISEVAAGKVNNLNDKMKEQLRVAAVIARTQLSKLEEERDKAAEKKIASDTAIRKLESGEDYTQLIPELHKQGKWYQLHLFPDQESVTREFGEIFKEASESYEKADKAYQEAQKAIETWNAIENGTWSGVKKETSFNSKKKPTGDGKPSTPVSTLTTPKQEEIDLLKEAVNQAKLSIDPFNASIQLTDTLLQSVTAREQILDMAIKTRKIPTLEQAQAKYILLNESIDLNKRKQNEVHAAADEVRKQLIPLINSMDELNQQHKSGVLSAKDFNSAISAIRPTVQALERDIAQYGNQWWEAEAAIESVKDAQVDMVRTFVRVGREIEREIVTTSLERSQQRQLEYIRDQKDAYKELSDARIDSIQTEIDALELENDLIDEQNKLTERQQAVTDAQAKVANIEANKNIRRINPVTGQWEWVADEVALREAKQDLIRAQTELENTQRDITTAARRRELKSQIEYERDIQRTRLASFDQQIKDMQEAQEREKDAHDRHWDSMLDDEQVNMDAMNDILEMGLEGAYAKWSNYFERVNSLQYEPQDVYDYYGGGGGGGGGSGGGSVDESVPGSIIAPPGYWDNSLPSNPGEGVSDTSGMQPGVPYTFYAHGGPILKDQLAYIHKDEYVLNAKTVKGLGGMAGVERLIARVNMPNLAGVATALPYQPVVAGPTYNNHNSTSNMDKSIKILGNMYFPQVRDSKAFVREMQRLGA